MIYNIVDYGAVADGVTDNSNAFKVAISECKEKGGTVYVPIGEYVTGPIHLVSHLTLYLEAGSVILFTDDFSRYPPIRTRWSGYDCYAFSPLLFGENLTNVTVKGEGVLDGQGESWWKVANDLKRGCSYHDETTHRLRALNHALLPDLKTNVLEWESQFLRPPLLQFYECKNITLEGITVRHSPFWNTHLVYCENVTIRGLTFENPADTPNGDGCDIDSCRYVRVSDCQFDVGDDCLCLKSGIDETGRRIGRPTEYVTVTNCTMARGHGGVVMGSENSGGIQHVTISNCVFNGTDRGIRLKTNRARGGYIRHILATNIMMNDVFCPVAINMFYKYGIDEHDELLQKEEAIPITEKTPVIEHIHLSHITVDRARAAAAFIYGLPEKPVADVRISHVHIRMTDDEEEKGGEPDMVKESVRMAGDGIVAKYVNGLHLHDVSVTTRQGPAFKVNHGTNVTLNDLTMPSIHEGTPVIVSQGENELYVGGNQASMLRDSYYEADHLIHDVKSQRNREPLL
ncbi:glycoside hydrolase family 28 protein [Salipaludibacillus agaradhaerens]|uniref:Glycoside hydrolase family 28 protein n=1 Tax=Salipaludibacillus agaradhaerens TaxID=76935 RepID=A0A9Q4AZ60_SALAG|nr:glycoside hydrolase family 28 protein [Salipaludibacillus agaradhaerens]MCR6095349.1 glycoside hydrolase family 28 protein [Salipaludibacillus agaradhaerens]MCR6115093.1 glycoside hydrolase family 28 protein [Salipaludibacillus agaradhaerens]